MHNCHCLQPERLRRDAEHLVCSHTVLRFSAVSTPKSHGSENRRFTNDMGPYKVVHLEVVQGESLKWIWSQNARTGCDDGFNSR